ncbi:hypothetical protein PR202_gb04998 [Eleusine coracana subsp. coracana]|uniref:Uncharacterized protein n=1 Tax=Eleusine coracana subsp. coracana TaxID=191504 RepID=A0AAV5E639_ELECO|nr:hypothetical protein QOZ80_1BG0080820 [Eleusine coracana subsp. coracana]GJN17892.1 hypothetical protein PR202_gb04998 [Eleusine coracana subsp. coracana]
MSSAMDPYSFKEDVTWAAKLILLAVWMTIPIWVILLRFPAPKFSVQLRDATGLDAAGAAHDGPISTAFNFTLHAANRRLVDMCYRNGEAIVRYSGYTVGWGRTPAFCVGTKDARDVRVVAWADGVSLPRPVRERMAADWRAGAVDLEVDVRLFKDDDGSARPTWMSCKVVEAGGAESPGARWCTIFALQNWASDIAPAYLMQYIFNIL